MISKILNLWGNSLYLLLLIVISISCVGCKQNKKHYSGPSEFELSLKANIVELNNYAKSHSGFSSKEVSLSETNFIRYDLLPQELKRNLDVKFYGDAKRFLRFLSNYCGFEFSIKGRVSSSSNNIYVNHKNQKLVDILNDVGVQLSDEIVLDVDVDVVNELFNVQLIYPN